MPTAEERKALRESINVAGVVDPELANKAGIPPVEKKDPETPVEEEPVATTTEAPATTEEIVEDDTPPVEPEPGERRISQAAFDRRIAKEVEKTRREREAREVLERRLLALEKKDDSSKGLTDAEQKEQIRLEAEKIANERIFNTACNNLAEAALKENKDFEKKLAAFNDDVGELPRYAIESILNLDNGHSVLNHIVNNPDDADKLLKMNPTRLTIELAKISSKLSESKIKRQTKAPAPIDPIGGRPSKAAAPLPTDSDSDAEWFEKRAATRRERVYR